MKKMLFVDHEKCVGCRTCEIACSLYHEDACRSAASRIQVMKWEAGGLDIPTVCQQCETPMCLEVCPVDAPFRDEETGAMLVDYDRCLGCRMCMVGCPFGAIIWDEQEGRIKKCDLCSGDPKCVKYCEPKAVDYVRSSKAVQMKKRAMGSKFAELLKKLAE